MYPECRSAEARFHRDKLEGASFKGAYAINGSWLNSAVRTERLSEKVRGVGFQPEKLWKTRQAGSLSHDQMPLLGQPLSDCINLS